MSFEDSDNDFNYDSDKVDEDLEAQLYGAVFFDSHLSNSDRINVTLNSPETATRESNAPEHTVFLSNSASAVTVSSFQDDTSPESDEFSIRNSPLTEGDDQTLNSTSCSSPLSDSLSSHNGLPRFTIDSSESENEVSQATEDWNASDVVIGVSKHSKSVVCNADDCEIIARRLARSRSDPRFWRVTRADRFSTPQTKRAARYFDDSFCSNCRQKGHLTSTCQRSGPVCILCGEEGHERDSCPNIYCYICFSFGHSKTTCSLANKLRESVCQRCGQQGHNSKTEEGKPLRTPKRLQLRPRGCCNCGRKNHAAEDCLRRPFRSSFPGPLPHRRVRVYDKKDIYARLRRVMEKKTIKKKKKNKLGKIKVKNSKKEKTASTSLKKETSCVYKKLDKDEDVSVVKEKERVEQHLFNCFSSRLISSRENSPAGPSADAGKTAETLDAPHTLPPPSRKPRRESKDGAAFLPLTETPRERGPRSHGVAGRKRQFHRTPNSSVSDSPFSWINRSTSFTTINDQPGNGYSNEKPHHPGRPYASTSSMSYHDRWRRATWRRNESEQGMKVSNTCPSLLALESQSPYGNSRRSRKQQQYQRRKKRNHEAESLPTTDFETGKRAKRTVFKQKKIFPVDQSSPHDESESGPRKRRSLTPKSKKTGWLNFVNRSTDVDPWD